jgi:Fe-S oxidoreductase
MVDDHDGAVDALTTAEQDRVVDECYQCQLCYLKCPYTPPHEWELDFPRLMLRATAVRKRQQKGVDVTDQFLGRTDLLGRVSAAAAPLVNKMTGKPGSLSRRLMEKTTGIAAQRLLPPYARERFSTWFQRRARPALAQRQASVALFPTCLVEYQDPTIGHDVVKVCERNGVACDVPDGTVCCGMPWLDQADFDAFAQQGRKNLKLLADQVSRGRDVIVPQATCAYVLKQEYPRYLPGADADLVAAHTYDVSEYLLRLHREEGTELDTTFTGPIPQTVTWHAACYTRAQNIGYKARDLLKLLGIEVDVVATCSGIDGTWGYRKENYALSKQVIRPLAEAIERAGREALAGDCLLANYAVLEETGRRPVHPVQIVARAYGIPEEPTA